MPNVPHLYIIGIGGVGTVWIADWALSQGWRVSGSDLLASERTERLSQAGANIHYGVDPGSIPADVTEVIANSAITQSSPSFPELEEVRRRGLPISKRAEYIGKITRRMRTLAVSGTHGKTTTTAMLGWILERAKLDPTVFVGGSLAAWGGKTKIGKGPFLVIEADEFDRSFHNFQAEAAIVLNIDADHLDYYKGGIEEIRHSFRRFLRNLPHRDGLLVGYGKDKNIRQVAKGFKYRFRWYDETHLWPGLKLSIPGKHNLLNATAAARVAHELGVSQEIIREALADFPGVGRRFELVGKWRSAQVYDDYAHHPREIAATLQGLGERFPDIRRTVVFQPHQKARTLALLEEFGRAFDVHPPDLLILAPIYQVAGREEDLQVSSSDIAKQIAKKMPQGMQVQVASDKEELALLVHAAAEQGGVLLTMGAGDIRTMLDAWIKE
jgi:UDP-N-acetylmuramate--alanine ligase